MRLKVLLEWPGTDRHLTKMNGEGLGNHLSCNALIEAADDDDLIFCMKQRMLIIETWLLCLSSSSSSSSWTLHQIIKV